MSGGTFEGNIGGVAIDRMAEEHAPPKPLFRRIEDFAVDNMRSVTTGASAALVLLAASLLITDGSSVDAVAPAVLEPRATGSITGQMRVPQLPDWQVVRKPVEIISLQAPHLERLAMSYVARRTSRNDREDAIIWQPPSVGGPEARVALLRGQDAATAPSLFVDMTRQQAERGVAITRAGVPGAVPTKFGQVEMADMTFSDSTSQPQACLAFRRVGENGQPTLSGWQCAAAGGVVERPDVACFIDRLALLKSGDDQELRRFFAEAETRRKTCPNARNTAGRKPTWLDQDGRLPAIRGSDEATGSIAKPRR